MMAGNVHDANPKHAAYADSTWQISPRPESHQRFAWEGGAFETASRAHTREAEGTIRSDWHLVMVTLTGGARLHEFTTDEGFRFRGEDWPGSASFLPAGCGRRLALRDVSWEWASISLPADCSIRLPERPFAGEADGFLGSMLRQFRDLHRADGVLDPIYCDTMKLALVQYLRHRGDGNVAEVSIHNGGITPRQMRAVADFVDANLAADIRIADLSRLAGLSEGYFHRAFRKTTGRTPLHFVNEQRVARAAELLATTEWSIATIALEVGFLGASHFARTFRAIKGVAPHRYRRML